MCILLYYWADKVMMMTVKAKFCAWSLSLQVVCVCVCVAGQVRLSQEHDKQTSELELMTNKHTIFTQKKLRVEAEITAQA